MLLYTVALHALQITWKNGVPKVKQGVSVGPLVAEDLAAVEVYAAPAVRKAFPITRGWSDHAFTATETPEHLVRQAASELVSEPRLSRKQRRRERERMESDD